MALLPALLSEQTKKTICKYMLIFSIIGALILLALLAITCYLFSYFKSNNHLIEDGDNISWFTIVYMITSGAMIIIHGWLGRVSSKCRSSRTRRSQAGQLGVTLYLLIISLIASIAMISLTVVHVYKLDSGLKKGIKTLMEKYASSVDYKTTIDNLQTDYQCCGSVGYREWYIVDWDESRLNSIANETIKSVPFSCCRQKKLGNCHNTELNSTAHIESINQIGCTESVIGYIRSHLITCGIGWIISLVFDLINLIMHRYIHSSTHNSLSLGTMAMPSIGWLCPSCCCGAWDTPVDLERDQGHEGQAWNTAFEETKSEAGAVPRRRASGVSLAANPSVASTAPLFGGGTRVVSDVGTDVALNKLFPKRDGPTARTEANTENGNGATDGPLAMGRKYRERYFILKEIR